MQTFPLSRSLSREKRFEEDFSQAKRDFYKRDTEAKDYQLRCESLTSKVDSLVKFLEEERALRKKAQEECELKDKLIQELQI